MRPVWYIPCNIRSMTRLLFLAMFLAATTTRAQFQPVAQPPDTIMVIHLDNYDATATRKWANDTARYRYNQMRYYVISVLPYVNAATTLFIDINNKLATGIRGAEKRRYIAQQEGAMRDRFEDKVKKLNETQGVLLIKLIQRQTGLNIYAILQETKGALPALKYQTWARLNGLNLSRRYHPEDEPDLERIMDNLGYPLRPDLAAK